MATTANRISRHKIAVIQAYALLIAIALIGMTVGLFIGRFTAPEKIFTVTERVNVPSFEKDKLPGKDEVTYFDVPLSHNLQEYIYEICTDENVPVTLVIAMIDHESKFNPETVSKTDDYGLMQINVINHSQLNSNYRTADMLNPYQNVFCGVKIIGSYIEKYEGDYQKALMAYNLGDYGMQKALENGVDSTEYTRKVMSLWEEYKEELRNANGIEP